MKVTLIILMCYFFFTTELYAQMGLLSYKKSEIEESLKTICNQNNDIYIEYPDGGIHFKGLNEDTFCYFDDNGIFNIMVLIPHKGELYLSYFAIIEKEYKSLSPFKWYYELENDITFHKHLIIVTTTSMNIDNEDKNIFIYKLVE